MPLQVLLLALLLVLVAVLMLDVDCDLTTTSLLSHSCVVSLLVSSVIYNKEGEGRDFLIVDAAMNDLIRPAMYEAHHDIVPVIEATAGADRHPVDIVGPVCESGDTFAKQRDLPRVDAGQMIAFRSAGAYGAVMASEYNSRPLIPEVLVNGHQFAVIRPRPSFDEMLNRDTVPEWL